MINLNFKLKCAERHTVQRRNICFQFTHVAGRRVPAVCRCGPWRTQTADDADVTRSTADPRGSTDNSYDVRLTEKLQFTTDGNQNQSFYETGSEEAVPHKTPRLTNNVSECFSSSPLKQLLPIKNSKTSKNNIFLLDLKTD